MPEIRTSFRNNFADATSKQLNYTNNAEFNGFLRKCVRLCNQRDNEKKIERENAEKDFEKLKAEALEKHRIEQQKLDE
jgi:hypothetical protein